jgi:hypothetical protein
MKREVKIGETARRGGEMNKSHEKSDEKSNGFIF